MNRQLLLTATSLIIIFTGISGPRAAVRENVCLELKSAGRYYDAVNCLHDLALSAKDTPTLEFAVLMTGELMSFPELYPRGLDMLEDLEKINSSAMTPLIRARIRIIRSRLLLHSGKIQASAALIDPLAFTGFMAAGPFSNSSRHDFDRVRGPEKSFKADSHFRGKRHSVSWLRVEPDRQGIVRMDDLFADTGNALFYFHRDITVMKSGQYRLLLGKTGYTDLWINGTKIFSSRKKHGFHHDQYSIPVHLEQGRHRILIKAGDSGDGTALSLRITDSGGKPVTAGPEKSSAPLSRSLPGKATIFPSLQNLLSRKQRSDRESFLAGYLYHATRINSEDNSEILHHFSSITKSSPFYAYTRYMLGLLENSIEKKEEYFKSARASNPGDCDSLHGIIKIKLANGFHYEADPLISELNRISGRSMFYLRSRTELFRKQGWRHEAIYAAEELTRSSLPSAGFRSLAELYMDAGRYDLAQSAFEKLYSMEGYNIDLLSNLVKCCEKTGSCARAKQLLVRGITLCPNNMLMRLWLADIEKNTGNITFALPILSSALMRAPWNRDVLRKTGLLYLRAGNKKLAAHFLKRALCYDPGNFALKKYYREITGETGDFQGLLADVDTGELNRKADQYRHEPAVILLSERATRVNADGSYRRHVRKVIRINSEETFSEFRQQYIIIEPGRETIEDLKCFLINGNRRIQIKEQYRKSLSDPESSLYYRLEAVIIPVSSMEKGSILDLQYVIHDTGEKKYRDYYGDRIYIGGRHRTLMTNIVLSHPKSRRIYYHLRGIPGRSIRTQESAGNRIHRIQLLNRGPYTEEDAMPHESEILPSVCFTSFRNMEEMALWYASLLRNRTVVSPEMKAALGKILSPEDSSIEKIRRIYRHVTDEIRYTGFEFGIGAIQPRRTDMTYHTRMGDCKDVSLLLAAMLKECGIPAKLALVRTRNRGPADTNVPFIGEFNHALCHVNVEGGFFLDGTAKGTGFRELPAADMDINALVIDEKGYKLINTGSRVYEKNHETVTNHITISEKGDAIIRRALVKNGDTAASARESLLDPEEKILRLTEYWNRLFPGSTVSDLNTSEIRTNKSVSYSYTVTIPSFAQVTENEIIFKVFPVQSNYYHNYTRPAARKFPLVLGHHWTTDINVYYTFPAGYRIYRAPVNEKFSTGSYSASFTFNGNEKLFSLSSALNFNTFRIAADKYSTFRKATRFIHRKENERIILVKSGERAR